MDRQDKVRSQRASFHELRSIPKGGVSHRKYHGQRSMVYTPFCKLDREQVGGTQETGKHRRCYTLDVT